MGACISHFSLHNQIATKLLSCNMESKELATSLSSPFVSSATRWWSKDTVAIVTGANKGIGFELVKKFAELGLTVILTARDTTRGHTALDSLLKHKEGRFHAHFFQLDISDPISIKTFVSWFADNFGALDILVNNAAVSFNDFEKNTVEHAETVMRTNFYGSKLLTESLLPMFRRSNSLSRILNISSRLGSIDKVRNPKIRELLQSENLTEKQIEGVVNLFLDNVKSGNWKNQGWPEVWTDYAVSKVAVNAYSRVLAKRYRNLHLSVNWYCPGFTQTSMTGGKGTHTAEDAAGVAASLALLPPEILPTGKFYVGKNSALNSKL